MMNRCGSLLQKLSLGKYNTKFYYDNKKDTYSTITGGIFTMFLAFAVLGSSLTVLYQTINWKNYTMTTSNTDLEKFKDTLTVNDLKSIL